MNTTYHPDLTALLTPWTRAEASAFVRAQNALAARRGGKLYPSQVDEIRALLADGMSRAEIARLFRVTTTTVKDIANGLTWKDAA